MFSSDEPIPTTIHERQDAAKRLLDDRMSRLLAMCGGKYENLLSEEVRLNTFLTSPLLHQLLKLGTSWVGGTIGSIPWLLSDHIAKLNEAGIELVETKQKIIIFRRIGSQ